MKKKPTTTYQQPQPFKPTPEQDQAVMVELAALFTTGVVITSTHNPELQVRGTSQQ